MVQNINRYQNIFPGSENGFWKNVLDNIEDITEIRIRVNQPIRIYFRQQENSLDKDGNIIRSYLNGKVFRYQDIQKLLDFWCMDSRYAFSEEIKQGFLTIKGGHRIGICGEVIKDAQGNLQTIKYISSLNIRIAHEVVGVANEMMEYIYHKNRVLNTLIISPPGAGKTTLLRDIVRSLSYGNEQWRGKNVGVVDERGEIAACFQGIPQLDVGPRTDILDNCEKIVGIRMLLRVMAPEVIAVDELGNDEEKNMVSHMVGRGSTVIATIHGDKKQQEKILKEPWSEAFGLFVFLHKEQNDFQTEIYLRREG
ncbi:MAG: stage III sporulation protein AA [Lachnospiraceae bacterium]|nr:stage III sporulation protein AA [Lachnospiraceae bacterium]